MLVLLVVTDHDMEHACLEPPTRPDEKYILEVNRIHLEGRCPHPLCRGRAIVPRGHERRTGRKDAEF